MNRSSEAVLRFFDFQLAIEKDQFSGEIADAIAFQNALDVIQIADMKIKPGKDGPRPKYPVLMLLVGWLEGIAAELGGAVSTKDRLGGQPGRLIVSLNLLRPIFPEGTIPHKLSAKTLEKWKTEHSRVRRILETRSDPITDRKRCGMARAFIAVGNDIRQHAQVAIEGDTGAAAQDLSDTGEATQSATSLPPDASPPGTAEKVGDGWIECREVAGDGREKWAIYSPTGVRLAARYGQDEARKVCLEYLETGSITR